MAVNARRDVQAGLSGPAWTYPSGQVEPVEVHDLVPRGHEVAHELLPRVVARVDLGERPELGVGAEDQVETAAGPLQLARPAVTALEGVFGLGRGPPLDRKSACRERV